MIELGTRERNMLNRWQRGFPFVSRPFARVAAEAGMTEEEAVATVAGLQQAGVICRVGAVVRPNTAGASTLAAVSAPADRLEEVASIISGQPEVTHNYEREHELNLWFVVTAADRAGVDAALMRIRSETGLDVLDLPMVRAFHIDLAFALTDGGPSGRRNGGEAARPGGGGTAAALSPFDRELLAAIEDGLPIVRKPYAEVARWLNVSEDVIISRLSALHEAGIITRFGFVVHHRELGYCANAMVVWDFDDEILEKAARRIAAAEYVTLCYQRPRCLPLWRYNLFCMIHGTSRETVRRQINDLAERVGKELGLDEVPHAVLFSRRRFKQCGARFSAGLKKGAA